jgi:hypothetical protein
MECSGAGASLEGVAVQAGFWRSSASSTRVRSCPSAQACAAGNATGDAGCREGHEGALCAVCSPGWTAPSASSPCKQCSGGDGSSLSATWLAVSLFGATLALLALLGWAVHAIADSSRRRNNFKSFHFSMALRSLFRRRLLCLLVLALVFLLGASSASDPSDPQVSTPSAHSAGGSSAASGVAGPGNGRRSSHAWRRVNAKDLDAQWQEGDSEEDILTTQEVEKRIDRELAKKDPPIDPKSVSAPLSFLQDTLFPQFCLGGVPCFWLASSLFRFECACLAAHLFLSRSPVPALLRFVATSRSTLSATSTRRALAAARKGLGCSSWTWWHRGTRLSGLERRQSLSLLLSARSVLNFSPPYPLSVAHLSFFGLRSVCSLAGSAAKCGTFRATSWSSRLTARNG